MEAGDKENQFGGHVHDSQLSGWMASLAGELRLLFFFAGHDMLKLLSGTELNRIGLSD